MLLGFSMAFMFETLQVYQKGVDSPGPT